jgi:pimeloyl-ACP methyl ester carboxylesterase
VADYDEFDALPGYAAWAGIEWSGPPVVGRRSVEVDGRRVSMLAWGDGDPEVVLVHGGGQNAHTWDTVAMALGRPLVAVDLPGHGHSDWREDGDYWPATTARTVAAVVEQVAPDAEAVVGMSLGGLTSIRLAGLRPDLVRRLVTVDVTPGVSERVVGLTRAQRGAVALVAGPRQYESFEAMLAALAETMPDRPVESLRPGLRHNARRGDDGTWSWRYDRLTRGDDQPPGFDALWADIGGMAMPVMLVRGARSAFVHDHDIATLRAARPDARVEVVDGAGHSVQSDRPVVLARLIEDFISST